MSKVVLSMSMSVDGFITGPDDGIEHGLGVDGERLHAWLSDGGVDPGSYRPVDTAGATVFDELMATGAVIVGRRTFEFAGGWAGDHHDGVPIFVLTHAARTSRARTRPLVTWHPVLRRARPRGGCDTCCTARDRAGPAG